MSNKMQLDARVRITSGPAANLYGRIVASDESAWTCDVKLDEIGVTDTEILVGGVASKTNPLGGNFGEAFTGAQAYFEMVNEKGGIYGRKLRVVVKDDSYKPETTVAHTRAILAEDNPIALFGFVGTGNVTRIVKGDAGSFQPTYA